MILCRHEHSIPEAGFPLNYLLNTIVEKCCELPQEIENNKEEKEPVKKEEEEDDSREKEAIICKFCEFEAAKVFCSNKNEFYCNTCFEAHSKSSQSKTSSPET